MKHRYVPYGYKIMDGQCAPCAPEAEAVKEVFRLYGEGCSYQTISDRINAGRFPAYSENGWNKHHVKRVLENSRYTGEHGYPAILGTEQFMIARAVHDEKIAGWDYGDDPAQILWERLICGECGGRMLRIGGKLTAKGIVQLRCKTPDCGNGADVAVDSVHRAVTHLQNRMLATGTKSAYSLYEPSAESLRLESQINRNIAKPDDPAETVRLILQGIDTRYRSIKAPPGLFITKKYDDENRLSVPDWDLFKEAVSHICLSHTGIGLKTISGEEFYMERNDVNASGNGSCPAGSDGHTCEPPAE